MLAAADRARSPVLAAFLRMALLTCCRSGELTGMQWRQVSFDDENIRVGRSKTRAGSGRDIPMSDDLLQLLTEHRAWYEGRFGQIQPDWYLFPAGERWPNDPTSPIKSFKTSWTNLRDDAGVQCRIHDLRHTAITKLAESGASDSTILAIAGHLSRAMLERYSHTRMAAKREAVKALRLGKESGKVGKDS